MLLPRARRGLLVAKGCFLRLHGNEVGLQPRPKCFGGAYQAFLPSGSRALRGQRSSSGEAAENSSMTPMLRHLAMKIKSTGPITVAEYMREALTNPAKGYYMQRDMLGERGDFITSPEISQIFGELIGIWFVSEWMANGKPNKFQLVELGPGRGSLTSDILRVFNQLSSLLSKCDISVHLVEISPKLSEIQASVLTGEKTELQESCLAYMQGVTKSGLPIFWYRDLNDVPVGFNFYLAHEFLDALPIHKFQKTEKGWRELLIDIDPEAPDKLQFVLAPSATPAAEAFIHDKESRDHVEVCPDAGVIIQKLAHDIEKNGGGALIIDYGHDGTKTDTFRVLLQNAKDAINRNQLLRSYEMLMDLNKMGGCFNFFAMLPHNRFSSSDQVKKPSASASVAGFGELVWK
ncbi:protein arginine methyltransferase NDUFAF7, mitochondrial isoform X3 [Sceloporus undulatus]|uniref:protein arginine methyltransferase NDUFAF7, mitochondrial isoform X3 n=1 Tax=Sceloporus undulatus TaxID=8520 RepID=UPI001C4B1C29|nr:protein arginine methyltransferase NDUFAF7, mitochondrial isoform X3 [Sceloporus undulatus]